MEKSSHFSTKQNIPSIVLSHGCKTVLDVGCADGSFTKQISEVSGTSVTGIDINSKNIALAKKRFPETEFLCTDLQHLPGDRKFDCIVFCSVLHEISSYYKLTYARYTENPIKWILEKAFQHLNPKGILIVRDGLANRDTDFQRSILVKFASKKVSDLFKKFTEEFSAKSVYNTDQQLWYELDKNRFFVMEDFLLEFLLTATWGTRSWKREVKERKLICTKWKWLKTLKDCGFKIVSYLQTNEEYPEYFEKICGVGDWNIPETTCLIVAKKK